MLVQERALRGAATSLRLIRDELWVCYQNGLGVHRTGEMNMLEEIRFFGLQLQDGTALSYFKGDSFVCLFCLTW